MSPGNPNVLLQRALIHGRVKDHEKAVAALDEIERQRGGWSLSPLGWSEKGLLLDKMGRPAEAFAAFSEALAFCDPFVLANILTF